LKKILLTGCAGFIGFHVTMRLLQSGYSVVGFDNLNLFYNEGLKAARLAILREQSGFEFVQGELANLFVIGGLFQRNEFEAVVHLAAQAGVRYSLENPHLYIQSNISGFVNLIEEARRNKVSHFVFASSSSVYGANRKIPFEEQDNVDHPISLYAATKKSDELIAHVYAHLYGLPVTGLRFFTVYGPWGRPDMAIYKFCKAIYEGAPIDVYNNGQMRRDFTYVDDIVEGVVRVLEKPPGPADEAGTVPEARRHPETDAPDVSPFYRIFNIGNNQPVELLKLIQVLEEKIGRKAVIRWLPMQPGDVPVTYASIDRLACKVGYRPYTPIEEGISRFVDWYREHYKV